MTSPSMVLCTICSGDLSRPDHAGGCPTRTPFGLTPQEAEDIHRGLAERLAAVRMDERAAAAEGVVDLFGFHAEAGRIRALMARIDGLLGR